MSLEFNLIHTTESGERRAQMHLPHQTVETPVFMPVGTAGSVKAVPQDIVESLGAQIILGNTYHLYLRPGHEAIRRMGGLHRFISWPRAMLTDSGGFQVYSLTQLRKVTDEPRLREMPPTGPATAHGMPPAGRLAATTAAAAPISSGEALPSEQVRTVPDAWRILVSLRLRFHQNGSRPVGRVQSPLSQ